jgi:hypothetical protein
MGHGDQKDDQGRQRQGGQSEDREEAGRSRPSESRR